MDLKLHGISRIDRKCGHYWFVRLYFVNNKPTIQKTFSDGIYGGISQSFAVAIAFRDANVKKGIHPQRIRGQYWLADLDKEKAKSKKIRDEWKQERIKRRLKAIEKFGRGKIYVGTGIDGMKKAREYGASQITCMHIKSGRQNFYAVSNFMPGIDFNWAKRKTGKHPDLEQQKKNKKKTFILGIGREAALKAVELGASQQVYLNILHGKQDFFKCCHTFPYFEINGFKQNRLTPEVVEKINYICAQYVPDNSLAVAAEVMLNYASRNEIPNEKDFITKLVLKYKRIIRIQDSGLSSRQKKTISLDINGDIERFNMYEKPMPGKTIERRF